MLSFSEYISSQNVVASSINSAEIIDNLVESIWNLSADSNSFVFTIGNGGSASTAEHFSADLSFCLNSQISLSSALANDYDYSIVLEKQLSLFKNSNYVLVAFSASGNSSNILKAIKFSLNLKKEVYCFAGFNGGQVLNITEAKTILFPDKNKNYGVAENLHLTATHYVIDKLIEKFNGI